MSEWEAEKKRLYDAVVDVITAVFSRNYPQLSAEGLETDRPSLKKVTWLCRLVSQILEEEVDSHLEEALEVIREAGDAAVREDYRRLSDCAYRLESILPAIKA